jgi:predicted nucleotidyltransferase
MNTDIGAEEILGMLRKEFPYLKERYKVASLSLFGSYVKKKQKRGSDVDILVTYIKTPGFFKFIELEDYLSDALGIKVDLVMENALKPAIGSRVKKEAIAV